MRQRAKVAAALVHDPGVLVLDEPFNGMDPRQRLQMMDLLRSLAADGATILFSSHILEEVDASPSASSWSWPGAWPLPASSAKSAGS